MLVLVLEPAHVYSTIFIGFELDTNSDGEDVVTFMAILDEATFKEVDGGRCEPGTEGTSCLTFECFVFHTRQLGRRASLSLEQSPDAL